MRFHSRDVARVEETWQQYVPSAILHDVDPRRFRFDWHSEVLPGMSIVRYDLAARVHSTAEPQDQFLACRVDGAGVRLHSDGADLDPARPWLTDGPRVHAHWDESVRVTALVFDREPLEQLARRITGDDTMALHVTDLSPSTAAAASAWDRMFDYVERSIQELEAGDALLRAELARHAATTTLSTFSTTILSRRSRSPQTAPAPATVRRALAYIAENAHRPITIDDVAAAVHISTRGLQYAFRRALDVTPAECLRQARLDGAHRELRSGVPTTVAAIARRWGFAHPSRFAAAYREAFGVLPSVTAGKHRR
ncbi:helix-turn-helix transcriptional regulator [Microbacterium hydrocarbonoxydans]|uniref:helix-turn-helix transcriptional regulator n=1 Tax=Microbacterium hydrocarbonoxydans TaxID=273678 RepID=UPI00203D93CC|nr:AraC family transcriptional regulator [Microbacterium hydrocarbonoxydans]MCM3778920.1 AraC family transcriptional regulator [Microbacterium hydrocarbonoxydans]